MQTALHAPEEKQRWCDPSSLNHAESSSGLGQAFPPENLNVLEKRVEQN